LEVGNESGSEFVIGVDLGGTKILAGVIDPTGGVLSRAKKKTRSERGVEAVIDRIARTVRRAVEKAELDFDRVERLGIGAPGALDAATGVVAEAPNLDWKDVPLKKLLEKHLGIPVTVENDVNAGTWGEYRLGAGVGVRDLVGIFVGTGIGGGLVLDGRLYRGSQGKAGEIGHIKIASSGPRCGCGQVGCFEALAGRLAIQRMFKEAGKKGKESSVLRAVEGDVSKIRSGAIAEGYTSGDKLTGKILDEVILRLADGIAGAVALLNPEMIVLGGGVIEALPDEFFEDLLDKVGRRAFEPSLEGLQIKRAVLGDDAVLLGAACIAREQ
jgi:glucokinase